MTFGRWTDRETGRALEDFKERRDMDLEERFRKEAELGRSGRDGETLYQGSSPVTQDQNADD